MEDEGRGYKQRRRGQSEQVSRKTLKPLYLKKPAEEPWCFPRPVNIVRWDMLIHYGIIT